MQISTTSVPRKTHLLTSRENTHLIPADLHHEIQVHDDGIQLLRSAIGSDEFLQTFLDKKLQEYTSFSEKLSQMKGIQAKFQILLYSLNAKARHLLRSISSSNLAFQQFCADFDLLVSNSFTMMFHIPQLTDISSRQIALAQRHSGMGLLKITEQADIAYLAALRAMIAGLKFEDSLKGNLDTS